MTPEQRRRDTWRRRKETVLSVLILGAAATVAISGPLFLFWAIIRVGRLAVTADGMQEAIDAALREDGFDYVPENRHDRSTSGDLDVSALAGWEFAWGARIAAKP